MEPKRRPHLRVECPQDDPEYVAAFNRGVDAYNAMIDSLKPGQDATRLWYAFLNGAGLLEQAWGAAVSIVQESQR